MTDPLNDTALDGTNDRQGYRIFIVQCHGEKGSAVYSGTPDVSPARWMSSRYSTFFASYLDMRCPFHPICYAMIADVSQYPLLLATTTYRDYTCPWPTATGPDLSKGNG